MFCWASEETADDSAFSCDTIGLGWERLVVATPAVGGLALGALGAVADVLFPAAALGGFFAYKTLVGGGSAPASPGGLGATVGNLWASMSAARKVLAVSRCSGDLSTTFVITSTSSTRSRSADGFTRTVMNGPPSGSGPTLETVPMGSPRG